MKITDPEIIKNGEQELIDAITADLDWGAIEEVFLKEHNLGIEEDIEYKSGDIVAFDNQIAYKLEFEVKVNLTVLLNRDGEYLSVSIANKKENPEDDPKIDSQAESSETEADTEANMHVGESVPSVPSNGDIESAAEHDFGSSGDKNRNTSGETDTETFDDFSDKSDDDMSQKVDDILKNIKNTG